MGSVWIGLVLATLVSEDLTCIGAGVLSARNPSLFVPFVAACALGIFLGDVLLFCVGKWVGAVALTRKPLCWWLTPERVASKRQWLETKGLVVIFLSRFIPGARLPTYFAAGLLNVPFVKFLSYFALAVLVWTPILVGLSFQFGEQMRRWYGDYVQLWLFVVLGVFIGGVVFYGMVRLFSFKGRYLLWGQLGRLVRWEFWSPYLFYIPVVGTVFVLAMRYRSLTLFTAANPCMPDGGFIGESKYHILSGLARFNEEFVAAFALLPGEECVADKKRRVFDFLDVQNCSFPVVIKPDCGQRGAGVCIVKNERHLDEVLPLLNRDMLVQCYVSGQEWGVFYYRFPEQKKGVLFSLTQKEMTSVVGDGQSNLEMLILRDSRARLTAKRFLKTHCDRLDWIPERGERVPLVELGTHCRGALFLDAEGCWSEQLEHFFDQVSCRYEGFFFGRFDVRAPNEVDFKSGKNIKVLELNGVTSEATHIYDPKHSLFYAYMTLIKQWTLAFQIGEQNRRKGVPVSGFFQLLKALRGYEKP